MPLKYFFYAFKRNKPLTVAEASHSKSVLLELPLPCVFSGEPSTNMYMRHVLFHEILQPKIHHYNHSRSPEVHISLLRLAEVDPPLLKITLSLLRE